MLRKGDRATLWGVERDETSPAYGEVVCPTINLWNATRRTKVMGSLSHDTAVEILNSDVGDDGRLYYRVSGRDRSGKIVMGWVSSPFIKEHVENG